MVDETFGEPVADALNKDIASIKAKTTFDCGFAQGTDDRDLIDKCKRLNRILLTFDRNTIDQRRYAPCSHAGIIIVKDKHWTTRSIVKELKRSRRRAIASLYSIASLTYIKIMLLSISTTVGKMRFGSRKYVHIPDLPQNIDVQPFIQVPAIRDCRGSMHG